MKKILLITCTIFIFIISSYIVNFVYGENIKGINIVQKTLYPLGPITSEIISYNNEIILKWERDITPNGDFIVIESPKESLITKIKIDYNEIAFEKVIIEKGQVIGTLQSIDLGKTWTGKISGKIYDSEFNITILEKAEYPLGPILFGEVKFENEIFKRWAIEHGENSTTTTVEYPSLNKVIIYQSKYFGGPPKYIDEYIKGKQVNHLTSEDYINYKSDVSSLPNRHKLYPGQGFWTDRISDNKHHIQNILLSFFNWELDDLDKSLKPGAKMNEIFRTYWNKLLQILKNFTSQKGELVNKDYEFGCEGKAKDPIPVTKPEVRKDERSKPIERPPRSIIPSFSPDVPPLIRNSITELLTAYNKGDGAFAYKLLSTDREEFRIVNAFSTMQIPIMEPRVSMSDPDQVKIEYKMPHPGDIIAAILQAGDDLDNLKNRMASLNPGQDSITKTEIWAIVQSGDQIQFDYGQKGILRLADVYGTSVHSYVTDIEDRRFYDKPIGGGLLSLRVASLMSKYFLCFDIETGSPEMERITKEIFARIAVAPKQQTREIGSPTYSLRVPSSWKNVFKQLDKESGGAIMYSGFTASGGMLCVGIKTELNASEGDQSDKTDQELLRTISSLNILETEDKLVDVGDSTVGGVDAKFFLFLPKPSDKSKSKILKYVFVKDKIIYSMTFVCEESDFDINYDEIMRIKETFRFSRHY